MRSEHRVRIGATAVALAALTTAVGAQAPTDSAPAWRFRIGPLVSAPYSSATDCCSVNGGVLVSGERRMGTNWGIRGDVTYARPFRADGTNIIANSVAVTAVNTVGVSANTLFTVMTPPIRMGPGATIYLSVFQNSGGPLNLVTALSGTRLSAIRLGA